MNDYSLFTYFGLGTLVGVGKDVNDKTFSFGGGLNPLVFLLTTNSPIWKL